MSEEDDDKQHEPSQKRLDDARKRGEIPKSNDLLTAASYGGFLLAIGLGGAGLLEGVGSVSKSILAKPDQLADQFFSAAPAPFAGMAMSYAKATALVFVLPMIAVAVVLLAQRAIHFAPEKLAFKLSRISPISNAKQKFGADGMFEFAKSMTKLLLVALVLAMILSRNAEAILFGIQLDPAKSMSLMLEIMSGFLFILMLVLLGLGGIDLLWQRHQHFQRNRMSRKEMMDEMKDSDGDPHMKQHRRQRAQEIATNQMLQDVKTADVVIVNPTHYAIALKWNRKSKAAPVCVAKGVDEIAARIRERAAEAGVPLHSDPPTARAIYATVEIGQQIGTEHYRAVAAAIRFSEMIRKRKRGMKA